MALTPLPTPPAGRASPLGEAQLTGDQYRLLFESNPVPMWAYDTATLRFLAVNDAAIRSYGFTREEFLSMTLVDVRPREDAVRLRQIAREVPEGFHQTGEWRHRKKDGTVFPVEITSHSIEFGGRPARLVLVTDITERRAVEDALRESEERFRSIVENSPLGLLRAALDGTFVFANDALARILGYDSADSVVGLNLLRICHDPDDRARLATAVREGSAMGTELELHRRDGSLVTVRLTARLVRGGNRALQVFEGFVEDVTPLRRAQDALRQSEKLAAIGQLISGVAHELNNPLSAILLFVETLLQEERTPEDEEALTQIRDQARRSRTIVRDLLSSARGGDVRRARTGTRELIERTARGVELQVEELGPALNVALSASLPDVEVDGPAMAQVITNLVVNAAQAAGAGGTVWLRARAIGAQVQILVEDSGPGIPPDVMSRLFEPFFTTKPPGQGTGLGLPVSRGIVESHQGTLVAENIPRGGARFTVTLPAMQEAIVSHEPPSAAPGAPAPVFRHVLIIDDEASIRLALSRFFSRRGWTVDEAVDGAAGLERLTAEDAPDYTLVVSDLKMPGLSGIELHDALATSHPTLLERVVFSTGDVASPEAASFIERSRCTVLQKPFELATLDEIVARFIAERIDE
jgi:PAS domain S-box-containing protein